MEAYLLPFLIAGVGGLLAWGVVCLVQGFTDGDRRKLSDRLSAEGRAPGAVAFDARKSILVAQLENSGLPPFLARLKLVQTMQRRVTLAFPSWTLLKFLCVVAGCSIGLGLVGAVVSGSPLLALIGVAAGGYAPFFVVSSRRNKRQKLISLQIPDALDFLSRVLRAGHSLTTGLQMMGEELPKPIGTEFGKCYDAHSLGQALEESLKDMAVRVESTDFAFFCTAVLIQRQTGGDLSEVLTNISGMIRQRIRLQQHVKAKTAEGRFTGYILVAFPAVMFVLADALNPDYAGKLLHTSMGVKLLMTAFGMQMCGLFAIRKLTTVKV